MASVAGITKAINLSQLATELGTAALHINEHGDSREVVSETTQAALQAAVDAHIPADEAGNRSVLEQRAKEAMAGNATYLASTPTAAQTTAQVKALTRQVNALIRLATNRLESTT